MTEKSKVTIVIGADHGGFPLLEEIISTLETHVQTVINCGAYELNPDDDYPEFAFKVGEKVAELEANTQPAFGVLLCKSGSGVTIAANKVSGIRAVAGVKSEQVKHAREHNNANVVSLSAEWLTPTEMVSLIQDFISTPFSQDERHHRRVQQIAAYESLS